MFTTFSRMVQRAAMIAALALACPIILVDRAAADFQTISGTYSRGQMMGACAAAGGTYSDNGKSESSNVGSATYGCSTAKGTVVCISGKCTGECKNCSDLQPTKSTGTVGGVLGNSAGAKAVNASATSSTAAQHKPGLTGTKPVVAVSHLALKKTH